MFEFLRYNFFSGNKVVYRTIAREFKTSPLRIYQLAHGKRARGNRDYRILKSLREQEIIKGVSHYR